MAVVEKGMKRRLNEGSTFVHVLCPTPCVPFPSGLDILSGAQRAGFDLLKTAAA